MTDDTQWIPLISWPRSWPTVSGLRQRISALERAGEPVPFVRRLGGRLLISPRHWDAWIDQHSPPRQSGPRTQRTTSSMVALLAGRIQVRPDPRRGWLATLPGLAESWGACYGDTADEARKNLADLLVFTAPETLALLEAATLVDRARDP